MNRNFWRTLFALLSFGAAETAAAQESVKEIIAAHVRLQGYKCDAPQSATRDVKASRPDEAVWNLACKDARYKVRLTPDMADVITPF